MSAESDLCFQHMDSFMLSDFTSLPDYEDFSKDIFIMNDDIDGIDLLGDLDCKDGLLNDFSSSLEGIKEEDEEEDLHSAAKTQEKGLLVTKPIEEDIPGQLFQVEETKFADGLSSKCLITTESTVSDGENLLISPRTMQTTNEMGCISLEEDSLQANSADAWSAATMPLLELASIGGPVSTSAHGDPSSQSKEALPKETARAMSNGVFQLSCTSENSHVFSPLRQATACAHGQVKVNNLMHPDTRPTIAPPIFHINSPPLSSPSSSSVSTPDKSPMFKIFSQEECANKHLMNTSVMQRASSMDLALRSSQADLLPRVVPHHVMQDASGLSTMHRSRSSHALGQFGTPGQLITCPEELNVASMRMPASLGYSNVNNMTHYQGSSSPGMAERSPTVPMRRVFSTGDIQARHGETNVSRGLEHVNVEETGLKVGHYTLEERKARLDRYRLKRSERNFSKKIKYACRKTLADSRPRIRGRFARTLDDSGEPLIRENGASYDDDYEEVDMLTAHCNMPNNRVLNFWNATGMNVGFQRGH